MLGGPRPQKVAPRSWCCGNSVVVSDSKERCGRLSEHPLPREDRLQRHCVICGENRVQVALVQDGHHWAVAVLEETGQGFTNLRLDQLSMMQPQQLPDALACVRHRSSTCVG